MNVYEKLNEVMKVEKMILDISPNISWAKVERLLRHKRLEKYSIWLTTGKIIPEVGQISPTLAHNGLTKITS